MSTFRVIELSALNRALAAYLPERHQGTLSVNLAALFDAAEAYAASRRAKPSTTSVEVWRVEEAYFQSPSIKQFKTEAEARDYASRIAGENTTCIKVYSAKQEVPA